MTEHIIIGIIVTVLLVTGIRKLWRVSSGKDNGACPGCPGCGKTTPCHGNHDHIAPDSQTATDQAPTRRNTHE